MMAAMREIDRYGRWIPAFHAFRRRRNENADDGTCEGADYTEWNAFTVQFHPEACSGPKDTSFLFDRFMSMMGGESSCR